MSLYNFEEEIDSIYKQETIEAQLKTWILWVDDPVMTYNPQNFWLEKDEHRIYVRAVFTRMHRIRRLEENTKQTKLNETDERVGIFRLFRYFPSVSYSLFIFLNCTLK
jgi:hypothetical protein